MSNVVFIVQQLSQPRCIKRIQTIYEAGIPIKVYGFDNGLYNDSLKSLPFPVHEIIKRSKEDSKLKKILFFRNTVKRILKENSKNDLFYVFGYEIGSFTRLAGCRHYVYEEADVSAARVKNPIIQKAMLRLDRSIIRNSYRTVLTSKGFIKCIFPGKIPTDKLVFLPNKLSTYFDEAKKQEVRASPIDLNHINFSFIGLIRYPNTIIRFAKVVGKRFPQHEFHFYGDPERDSYIDDEIKSMNNVFFHGRFKNPVDLPEIYSKTDISIVCYDTTSGNVRIAEPNKIYESIFFETPIVVSSGTFLAERVAEFGIGYDIDCSNDAKIIDFINSLSIDELNIQIAKMHSIPWQEVVDNANELTNAVKCFNKR